ncbi:hypothetical protein ABZZ17_08090 [Streptomyces sp. NPDC006512]|uniref:hypothetical protein n=1 Tax=Streptomyces sp. NPDC006512 TaxID=3154307 RepID=UPI00339FE888
MDLRRAPRSISRAAGGIRPKTPLPPKNQFHGGVEMKFLVRAAAALSAAVAVVALGATAANAAGETAAAPAVTVTLESLNWD